jgi:hypothetical protein
MRVVGVAQQACRGDAPADHVDPQRAVAGTHRGGRLLPGLEGAAGMRQERLPVDGEPGSARGAGAKIAFNAASGAYLKTLVRPEDPLVANGRFESTNWTSIVVGPPLGGAAIGLSGPVTTVLADAVSYLLWAAGIRAAGAKEPRPGGAPAHPGYGPVTCPTAGGSSWPARRSAHCSGTRSRSTA